MTELAQVLPLVNRLNAPSAVAAQPSKADHVHDTDEARWIERANVGDPEAIDQLVERYRERVVRLAAHVLRRPDEAEDVAQEAFIRAFRSLDSYRGEGKFYTWLYQIVVRECIDRRKLSRWTREISFEHSEATSQGACADLDNRLVVDEFLKRLNPDMRAMIVLRELEGLDYAEIAEVLGIPIGRVRWRLHGARRQFRELWLQSEREGLI